jgi:hypothetical protein
VDFGQVEDIQGEVDLGRERVREKDAEISRLGAKVRVRNALGARLRVFSALSWHNLNALDHG